jgi:hypothetical protein
LVKTATDRSLMVAVIKIEITGDFDCNCNYELIIITTTNCRPLLYSILIPHVMSLRVEEGPLVSLCVFTGS